MTEVVAKDSQTGPPAGKWATFFLHGEMFGLRVEDVQEVMMDQPLTSGPRSRRITSWACSIFADRSCRRSI